MDRPPSDEATLAGEVRQLDDEPGIEPGSRTISDIELPGRTTPRKRIGDERRFTRGDEVGRYVILEQVGVGGMGVVYAAWDPKLDRKVALKLLHGDKQAHGQRLLREAQAMARLKHPNVVAVFDADAFEGRVFVAMEFVEGQTLSSWASLQRSSAESRVMQTHEREWPEILEVLLAAGRGLAAAHAQGLVHRDFKPDNVMIDSDARVRVMDFGLVREAGGQTETETEADDETEADASEALPKLEDRPHMHMLLDGASAFESQLTLAGALLGTPAYMAPEQLRGEAADSRSDQFGFCVVAWQCFYGTRPFAGDTPLATLFSITQAAFREAAPGRVVPSHIRRVLERGLAAEPSERWPDMQSLLRALAEDPRARRRPYLLAGASLAISLAAAVAAIVIEPETPPSPCAHAGDEIGQLWTEAREAELAAAFARSELVYADESWPRVAAGLDRWSGDWVAARRDACEDTELRHAQSPELLDLRMACLDQRLHRFRALVDVLAAADDTVIEKAVEAVEALPSFEVCADRSWLTADVRPPEDPALAESIEQVRERIARALALTDGGKLGEAVEIATQAEAEARQLAWQPLLAEAATSLGQVRQEQGDFEGSRAALETGFFAARRGGHDEITVRAAYLLIYTLSLGLAEFTVADDWAAHALAEAERIGRVDLLAEVQASIGIHHYVQAHLPEAAAAFERALELHAGPNDTELATAHINYGTVLVHIDRKRRNEAIAELDLGLSMLTELLGPNHPSVAVALSNYATVLGALDEQPRAIELFERALAINERALGSQNPMTALVELNLSTSLGKLEPPTPDSRTRALSLGERSLATHRVVFGEQHTRVAESHKAIARALLGLGRAQEAIAHLDAAQAIWTATFGDEHEKVQALMLVRAACEHQLGNREQAIAMLTSTLGHTQLDPATAIDARLLLAEYTLESDPTQARHVLDELVPQLEGDSIKAERAAALRRRLDAGN